MKLIIILLVVLLAAGGGAGYYFFVFSADTEEEAPPPPPPDIRFIEMEPLRIPVIRSGIVTNYVILNVTLEVEGPRNEETALSLLPRLRNAYLTDLNGYFETVSVQDRILVKAIKRRLRTIADRTFGTEVINNILIQNAFKQKG